MVAVEILFPSQDAQMERDFLIDDHDLWVLVHPSLQQDGFLYRHNDADLRRRLLEIVRMEFGAVPERRTVLNGWSLVVGRMIAVAEVLKGFVMNPV